VKIGMTAHKFIGTDMNLLSGIYQFSMVLGDGAVKSSFLEVERLNVLLQMSTVIFLVYSRKLSSEMFSIARASFVTFKICLFFT